MTVMPKVEQPNPRYWSGSALVDGAFVVKFAWAQSPALRVWREGVLLQRLAMADAGLAVPRVVAVSQHPALAITEVVEGKPLSWEWGSDRSSSESLRVGAQIGAFLARLHAVPAERALADLPTVRPDAQADTLRLRERYPALVDERRAELVSRWCDWVDDALTARSAVSDVLVHGDLHGHNQVWDHDTLRLVLVVDFEEAGLEEAEFDFRYLPGNSRHPELTLGAIEAYQEQGGAAVDLRRVLAWNVRTHLGDAPWRTEAHVPLPVGGNASTWVDDLTVRLRSFGFGLD